MRSNGPTGGDATVYIFNTKQMRYVDSILLGPTFDYDDIEVSVDERYLILATSSFAPYNVSVIDLTSRQVIHELINLEAETEISQNGKYIAIQGIIPLYFLDANTFDTVAIDTGGGYGGTFDSSGNIFYSTRWRTDHSVIRRFDVKNNVALPEVTLYDSAYPGYSILRIQPTADPNKIFAHIYYSLNFARVVQYNITTGVVEHSYIIKSQNTEFSISPDWNTLLFTDPTNLVNGGTKGVYFVNTNTASIETIVVAPPATGNPDLPFLNPKELAFSPDGKYAMVSSELAFWHGLISIPERKYIGFFKPDSYGNGTPSAVACRAKR